MKKLLVIAGIVLIILAHMASKAVASQIRVDSMASLGLVVTDPESEITPYDLGNPAGLALLSPQTNLELSVPWYSETSNNKQINFQYYGASPDQPPGLPNLENSTVLINPTAGLQYQGFLDVEKDHWAYQVSGGLYGEDLSENAPEPVHSLGGYGLVSAAGILGPLSFGTEIEFSQRNDNSIFYIQMGNNPPVALSTKFNETELFSNTGLLLNIPLEEGSHPVWLRAGGSFLFDILPNEQDNFLQGSPEAVYKLSTTLWEPCLYLEVPGTFQGGLVAEFHNTSSYSVQASTTSPTFPTSTFNLMALYKWKIALSRPGEAPALTLNHGLLFGLSNEGLPSLTNLKNQLQVGVGLEREKDFTVGVQLDGTWNCENFQQTTQPTKPVNQTDQMTLDQICLGGEKWLTPQLAIRLGLIYENAVENQNTGGPALTEGFYSIKAGQQAQGWMPTAGVGFEERNLKLDGVIWFENPQLTTPNGSVNISNILGAGISAVLALGS